jgi:cell division protein FtsW
MSFSRADKSRIVEWAFTIDRLLLSAFSALIVIGCVLSFAASPAVALKKGLPTYYFVERHLLFAALATIVMLALSFLSPSGVRRAALAILIAAVAGMVVVLVSGAEMNGAQRWLSIAGHSLQPSEFAKPAFIVIIAWLFAEAVARHDVPAAPLAFLLWGGVVALLVSQPDVGQTVLISTTAGIMYVLAGLPLLGAAVLAALGGVGLWLAYENFGHVHSRLDRFFSAVPFENYQVDRAMQSFVEGGFFGRGPGEGTIKTVLPDAHTDFIFAVVGEEYGIIACLALLSLFALIVLKALIRAAEEPEAANRLAIQGLAVIFGLQAVINMGVNIGLLPPKGMTLPFISAGGSSMIALAITAGFLLALTRHRPHLQRLKKPRLVPTLDSIEYTETGEGRMRSQ